MIFRKSRAASICVGLALVSLPATDADACLVDPGMQALWPHHGDVVEVGARLWVSSAGRDGARPTVTLVDPSGGETALDLRVVQPGDAFGTTTVFEAAPKLTPDSDYQLRVHDPILSETSSVSFHTDSGPGSVRPPVPLVDYQFSIPAEVGADCRSHAEFAHVFVDVAPGVAVVVATARYEDGHLDTRHAFPTDGRARFAFGAPAGRGAPCISVVAETAGGLRSGSPELCLTTPCDVDGTQVPLVPLCHASNTATCRCTTTTRSSGGAALALIAGGLLVGLRRRRRVA